jgi:glycerate 2-kinase
MKIVIAPDTFKGTLTASEAAEAMARGVVAANQSAEIVMIPVGDGGEGTAAALERAMPGAISHSVEVTGPMGRPVAASFVTLGTIHSTAALDMASAAGLLLVAEADRDPMRATTFGVGKLIDAALGTAGVRHIVIGLGGSATNDCGAGCLQAMGYRLVDSTGSPLPSPLLPSDLSRVVAIDGSDVSACFAAAEVTLACDVDNPLAGPRGASRVFGPQKGASPSIAKQLDALLAHFGAVLDDWRRGSDRPGPRRPISARPGSGAAGGLGAALMAAFSQATVRPGIDVVLDVAGFDDALAGASLVLTGEGRLDSQTLGGKAIHGVLKRAAALGVPVIAIVGSAEAGAVEELKERGLLRVIELVENAGSPASALAEPAWSVMEAAMRVVIEFSPPSPRGV